MTFSGLQPICRQLSLLIFFQFSSVQLLSCVRFLQPHELQHARPPCPSPSPGVYPNSCPSSRWCHPAISSSVVPFYSCPKSLRASGSFPMSQLFVCSGQSIGVSASSSVLPMNTQDLSPLGWTGWIFLQSKGLSRVFSNTSLHPAKNFHHLILDCLLQNKRTSCIYFFTFQTTEILFRLIIIEILLFRKKL